MLEATIVRPDVYREKKSISRRMAKLMNEELPSTIDENNVDHRDAEKREREEREKKERRRRLEGELPEVPECRPKVEHSSPTREPASPTPMQLPPLLNLGEAALAGGFRRGESVKSLVSRERRGLKILEMGHEGIVIGAVDAFSTVCGRYEEDHGTLLLVQFRCGFDWLLSPHQICTSPDYSTKTATGLPGGFTWGDRVRNLTERLSHPGSERGILLGDAGIVVGPGHTFGKLAIRFDDGAGEWNVWPGALCRAEDYVLALVAEMAGSFRRGDRVRTKAARSGGPAGVTLCLQDGSEGIVLGPGHAAGRVLVRCEDGRAWSLLVSQVVAIEDGPKKERRERRRTKDTKESLSSATSSRSSRPSSQQDVLPQINSSQIPDKTEAT
jgi:hypothetical protein